MHGGGRSFNDRYVGGRLRFGFAAQHRAEDIA